jgi:RNA polymerase sigma-70 factor (ECF subfamily)
MNEENLTYLVSKLKGGDIHAFESIYNLYRPRIFNFCLKLLPSFDDALDATQKVFIAIWEQKATLDPEKSFTSYIYSIARYTAYHDFKSLVYRNAAFEQITTDLNIFSEAEKDEVLFREMTEIINRIIDQLPPQRRMIFRLSRFYQLTYRTIAEKLSITENTVDTQIRRALDYIRKEYQKAFN